jgi:hypothetical protein
MSENNERWLSELYRASSQEQPPAVIDERILAAARNEPSRRVPPFLSWGVPFAAAAVVVLTVSLVVVLRDEPADTAKLSFGEPPQATAPSSSEAVRENAAADSTKDAEAVNARRRASAGPQLPKQAVSIPTEQSALAPPVSQKMADQVKAAPEAKAEAAAPAAQPASSPPASPALRAPLPQTEAQESAEGRSAPAASAAANEGVRPRPVERSIAEQRQAKTVEADQSSSKSSLGTATDSVRRLESRTDDAVSPEQWLERIDKLRKEGRDAEAKKSLAEFRKRYPAFPLPEHLK